MDDPSYDEFTLNEYRQCFESIKHYDSLSWTVAMFTLAIVGSLIAFLIKNSVEIGLCNSLVLRVLGTFLVIVWFGIYERNRYWVEAANERARDIERECAHRDGLGISFARAALSGKVILKNTDASGKKIEDKPPELVCPLSFLSMHYLVRILAASVVIALWIVGRGKCELNICIRLGIPILLIMPFILKSICCHRKNRSTHKSRKIVA